jgi:actin-like ATPase involved in cell morphogenesis
MPSCSTKRKHNLLIRERTAEAIKIEISPPIR